MAMCRRPVRPAGEAFQFTFGRAHAGQHVVGEREHAQPGRGESQRPGAPVEQLGAQPVFQFAKLVGQRGLRDVQAFGRFDHASAFTDGGQRFKVANIDHGGMLPEIRCDLNISHTAYVES